MYGRPTRQRDQQTKQATNREKYNRDDGVGLDKFFSCPIDTQTGCRAGTVIE